MEVGLDQQFVFDLWNQEEKRCGQLTVRKLPLDYYATCRSWVGAKASTLQTVHVTYCRQWSEKVSREDVCKSKLLKSFLTVGGVTARNLTSTEWNAGQGC